MSIENAASIFIKGPSAGGSVAGPIAVAASLIAGMFRSGQSGRSDEANAAYEIAPGGPNSKSIDSLVQKFYSGADSGAGRKLLDDLFKPADPNDKDIEQILHARRLVSRAIESPQSYDLFPGSMRGQTAGAYERFRDAFESVANRPSYKTAEPAIVQTFKEYAPQVTSSVAKKLPSKISQMVFKEINNPILIQRTTNMSSLSLGSLIRTGLTSVTRSTVNTAANQLGRIAGTLAQRLVPGALAVISKNPTAAALSAGYTVSSNAGPIGGYMQRGADLSQRLLERLNPYYGEEPETAGSIMRTLGIRKTSNRGLFSSRKRRKNRCLLSTKDVQAFRKVKKLGLMLTSGRTSVRRSKTTKTRRSKNCRTMTPLQRQYFCKKKKG